MPRTILAAFDQYQAEGAIIGKLVAGYGEIEYEIGDCLGCVLENSEMAVRVFFRLQGEQSRLEIADALMRPKFENLDLAQPYATAWQAFNWSKKIRNQYAHCHWIPRDSGLFFTDFDKPAKQRSGELSFEILKTDLTLLKAQEAYFCFATDWAEYLNFLYRSHTGGHTSADAEKKPPSAVPQPNLYIPLAG